MADITTLRNFNKVAMTTNISMPRQLSVNIGYS
jgi:hypothetical protein